MVFVSVLVLMLMLIFVDSRLVRRRKACLVQSVAFQDAVLFADSRLVRKSKGCLVEGVVGRDDSQQRKFGKSLVSDRRAKTV